MLKQFFLEILNKNKSIIIIMMKTLEQLQHESN